MYLPLLEFGEMSDDASEKVVAVPKISSSTDAGVVILNFVVCSNGEDIKTQTLTSNF